LQDFTPVLRFGGVSTGITYSKQLGRAVTYAGVVHEVWIDLVLTSKGSATGVATISGLVETNNSGVVACSADIAMSSATGSLSDLKAEVEDGSAIINLFYAHGSGSGAASDLDNGDFTNSTAIHVHLSYRVV
jgi:hypothetical protein